MSWIHHSKNGRKNWIVRILYELTQPAKWYFWKLYHCARFCWRGAQRTLSRQVHWRSGDKSPLTKRRETSTGVWFFHSKDLWKLFPETLKQKMCPVFSYQVRGDWRRPWPCSRGVLCCPPRSLLGCHGAALGTSAASARHLYGGTCKQLAPRPAARGVGSCVLQTCTELCLPGAGCAWLCDRAN